MNKFFCLLLALSMTTHTAARADEPVDTVRVLLDMAAQNSADPINGRYIHQDYFSANMLLRFFSEDFTQKFAMALLKTNERRHELMIDWDPIVGGQDNCPLENITYGPATKSKSRIEITVAFEAKACFGDDSGGNNVSKVTFTLEREELMPGSPVYLIDDIAHPGEPSLKTTLVEIAK
ncbi:hypothetical protein [Pararhizobium antarcticum]|uniref:DUF3828 domain-containing protein n=1 Tax=Pararhizobium antarcticum TaxID=1798805 RepID=A0A657LPN2_9HYPH|nr:hypothetical protein [Pararhizobium antarcticum]OJF92559.1 hypothetical protein AX760_22410 [Pararhizobium antarcticum]OJF95826.1 hypothetical protein AX761_16955 [Rhizobium sp. 58]